MVQISANAALPAYSPADFEGIWAVTPTTLVAILQAPAGGAEQYAVSTDSGATWAMYSFPSESGDVQWQSMTKAACYGFQFSSGAFYQFGILPSGKFFYATLSFNGGTNQFIFANGTDELFTGTSYTNVAVEPIPAIASTIFAGAIADGSNIYVFGFQNVGIVDPWYAAVDTKALNYSHSTLADMHLRVVSAAPPAFDFLLTFTDVSKGQLIVVPLHYNESTHVWGSPTPEVAYTFSGSNIGHTPLFDSSGKLDLIIRDGSNLYAVKRNGTGSYSPAIPLYSSVNQTTRGLATSFDVATGNLIVAFESTVNQSAGEIFAIKRTAGVWGNPTLLAGGNADGYSQILMSKTPDGSFTPAIFKHGAGVDYLGVVAAGPPFTPTVSTPAGNITSLTPVLAAPYVNPSPSDPQGFYQWQVQRVSDSSVFLDTGKTAGANAFLTYAGTALVYGTQYQARVRYWDSISSSGSGTASGWSAWSTFTPVHGPVATITSIVADAVTIPSSPGTLLAPTLSVSFDYTQAESDAANSYRLKFYAADGVTLVAASAAVAGTIAAGASVTTFDTYFPALRNSTVYKIAVESTDSVTGLSADGPQWQLTTAWAPPPTPSAFLVQAYPDLGTVVGTFVNDGTAVTNNVYAQLPNGDWTLYKTGSLFTGFTARPPTQTSVNYRVTAVGLTGIESAPAQFNAVTLGLRGNFAGIWYTDINDPSRTVAAAVPASWSDMGLSATKDRSAYTPLGGTYVKSKRGLEYWEGAQMKYWHPGTYLLKDGSIARGQDDVDMLRSMDIGTSDLHYRDPSGLIKIVELYAFKRAPDDPSSNFTVEFSLDEKMSVSPPGQTSLALLMT